MAEKVGKGGVTFRALRVEVGQGGVEVEGLIGGPNAREFASDLAGSVIADGGDITMVDLRTGESTGSRTFSGVGGGKWDEIKADARAHNGRLKIVHNRGAGLSPTDIVQ